jgi:hypothetical protein
VVAQETLAVVVPVQNGFQLNRWIIDGALVTVDVA